MPTPQSSQPGADMPSDDTGTSQGQFVRVNGTDIFYRICGQGEPLLLIHAGTVSGKSWEPYIAALGDHFRLIIPDTPGHGRSGTPIAELSYPGLADDMAAFAAALDLRKPLVAGYSDGGQIALELGMRHPAVPRALVIGGAFFRFNPAYSAWLEGVFGADPAKPIDAASFVRNHPDWAGWLQQIYGLDAWPSVLARVRGMWTTSFDYSLDELARIVAPSMILVGDRDEILPVEEAVELYRRLRRAELAVVPGADHGAFFAADAHAFRALMLDFLLREGSRREE